MFQIGAPYRLTDTRQAGTDAPIAKIDSHVLEAESINTSEVLPLAQASAVYEQDDGTWTPAGVDLRIQELDIFTRATEDGTLYEVKAPAKKGEGSVNGGHKVQANVALHWVDNLGSINELHWVRGEWVNSLYNTTSPRGVGVLCKEFPANVPSDNYVAEHLSAISFDYYVDDIIGHTLGVQTSIKYEKSGVLYLIVTSSMFS